MSSPEVKIRASYNNTSTCAYKRMYKHEDGSTLASGKSKMVKTMGEVQWTFQGNPPRFPGWTVFWHVKKHFSQREKNINLSSRSGFGSRRPKQKSTGTDATLSLRGTSHERHITPLIIFFSFSLATDRENCDVLIYFKPSTSFHH